MLVTGVCY